MSEAFDEKLMVRYLLGELSQEEMAQIEERLFADDDYFDLLSAVEQELVDRFVRGELAQDDRERFERYFLASPRRRESVEFAGALLGSASGLPLPETAKPEQVPFWRSLWAFLRSLQPPVRFALSGATLLLIVSGSWLIVETSRLRTQLALLEAGRGGQQARQQELRRRLGQQSARIEQLDEEVRRERAERTRLEQRAAPGAIVSFVLTPGLVRDPEASKRVVIPSQARRVTLQLDVAGDYRSYRAAIRTAEGREVWSQDMLKAQRTDSGKAVVLNLPSDIFPTGEYTIGLRGLVAAGKFEALESYQFSVLKR